MTDIEHHGPDAGRQQPPLPDDALILLPVRDLVLFPQLVLPVGIGRRLSVAAAQQAVRDDRPLGVLLQRERETEQPAGDELYPMGTVANVLRFVSGEDGNHHLVLQGVERFRVREYLEGYPFLVARVERIREEQPEGPETEARVLALRERALEALELLPQAPRELAGAIRSITEPGLLADAVAGYLDLSPAEKQELLEETDVISRLDRVQSLLDYRVEVLRLSQKISQRTQETMSERQREAVLREQLRSIQQELGEGDDKGEEIRELDRRIGEAGMPEEAEEQARKELKRLERMPEGAAEYSMVRTYLDWLLELPWSQASEEHIDIARAREILDEDHYGLEPVKRRILEHLAVRKLNPEGKSPILCFVGPPGVGKTSLGQSIARATGREFVRASLGGVHDESEIRGHRRTYIGALPGKVIQGIRKAGANNPVFMLDEMDKLGAGIQGDPSAALLEVLDPAQNSTFQDNYLGVTFDLSPVMFIGTANVPDQIPGPLRDRMELIELPGYTEDEKVEIARRYLLPRQREAAGLREEQLEVTDAALHRIVAEYTREAGCRQLERQLGAVARHVAVRIAEGRSEGERIDADDLHDALGAPKYENEVAMRTSVPGVATGLAWTPVGGDILFIEASRSAGSGRLILTGQLGDVMKESAQTALSLIKARADELAVDAEALQKADIHVHVPAGAIPKDGPSAGVAMYTALVSLLTGRCVRESVAMTGEITLRGLVLPVGGIKEKVLAAQRAGITTVLLPARNRKDWEDIPEHAREKLEFRWIDRVDDAVEAALQPAPEPEPA
ncbi:endopeptidase La [Sediminicurvatus halobius]|uniref:Lon protease n=1 Tax=Sediminicurvatus halobius TaxID=2182432 RepID=A0A2U2N3Z2_9GAMM|nr:endopeptidase La [Spiribacter halobius]PWG63689.1 endopeptidase La [Spiribacter halobius]UEX79828.1 endopeptidase La [Spiribacter halobius]